ncbi:MAG: YciI family protein [Pseudohongiella sp.]|nr:YciI family protein [Pseudohongiella sp.]
MLFIIRFTDHQDKKSVRDENLKSHISWLADRSEKILIAGSLREDVESSPIGAFWVVEASSKDEVEELYTTDPFWISGLRKDVEILHWSKAFPNQQVLV